MSLDVKNILKEMIRRGASDLHLAAGLPPSFRTDRGRLEQILAILIDTTAGSAGGAVRVRVARSERDVTSRGMERERPRNTDPSRRWRW